MQASRSLWFAFLFSPALLWYALTCPMPLHRFVPLQVAVHEDSPVGAPCGLRRFRQMGNRAMAGHSDAAVAHDFVQLVIDHTGTPLTHAHLPFGTTRLNRASH